MGRKVGRPEITQELAERGFLSDRQAAERINMSTFTLNQWRHHGRGPRYYKLAGAIYYRADDVDAWIEAQAHTPGQHAA